MKILDRPVKKEELSASENFFGDEMVKGVVDVRRGLLAVDAEMHYMLEQLLLSDGSKQEDLWGINLYPKNADMIEFDSMINIRPNQGNRSRGVDDEETREKIREVVSKWVK